MQEFLLQIIRALESLDITPIVYGSFGAANYLGDFKVFDDIDILIDAIFMEDKWLKFKELMESKGFVLVNEREHEFEFNDRKVGFASKDILIRDNIINDYSELVKYKDTNAYTLTSKSFLRAYQFSLQDGYRITTRGKKDQDVIDRLKAYIKS